MKMTDEEMAKEYAVENWEHFEEGQTDYDTLKRAFLAGLKAGRPKWHNLQEDPTDIPPMKDDTYSIEVWVKGARGNYGTAVFSYACHREDGKYNHWVGTVPVLWIELPKFEEE